MDDEPFIVMPFIKRGNVRDYIHTNPQCDRVRIVSYRRHQTHLSDGSLFRIPRTS
jgi:hypothetical protein